MLGKILSNIRKTLVDEIKKGKYRGSLGKVPRGCQPCVKCGGSGSSAGSGYYVMKNGNHGRCFNCFPRNGTGSHGLGYITRSKALSLWGYQYHHPGVGLGEIPDPHDNDLWQAAPLTEVVEMGEIEEMPL